MATILNERQKVLDNTAPRFFASGVTVSGTSTTFIKPSNLVSLTPSSVTLTAAIVGYTTPIISWSYALSSSPTTWNNLASTSSTAVVSAADFQTALGTTNSEIIYRCIVTQNQYPTSTGTYSIAYAREGNDGVIGSNGTRTAVLDLYQWATSQPAAPSGTSTYTWSTATFTLPDTPGSWTLTPGTPTANQLLYVARKVYPDTTTDATSQVSWTGASILTQSKAGSDGTAGQRVGILEVYKWAATQPTTNFPTGTSVYTWSTGTFTAPTTANGWANPASTSPLQGDTLWAVSTIVSDNSTTLTSIGTWAGASSVPYAVGYYGVNAVNVVYTNSSLTVPVTTGGVENWIGSGGILQVYDGATLLLLRSNTQTASAPASGTVGYHLDITRVSGDTLTEPAITGSGTNTATIAAWASDLTQPTVYRITAYVRRSDTSTLSQAVDVTITPANQGATGNDSTAYWLMSSAPAVQKSIAGVFTPSSVNYTIKSAAGTSSPANYAGRFTIDTSTDGTNYTGQYTSAVNESTASLTVTGSVKTIRARAYLAGGITTLLDELITTIVSDGGTGNPGVDGISVSVTRPAINLPSSDGGVVSSYTNSGTDIKVFEGNNALTYVTSNPGTSQFTVGTAVQSPTNSITVGAYSGNNTTALTVANHATMADATNSVVLTYPLTIKRANGTSVSIDVSQSLAKAKAGLAVNGINGGVAAFAYAITSASSLPASPSISSGHTPTAAAAVASALAVNWYLTPASTLSTGQWMFQVAGVKNQDGSYTWTNPSYLSTFRVGQLDALGVSTGTLTVDKKLTLGTTGTIQSSNNTGFGQTGVFLGGDSGTYKFSVGSASSVLSFDGTSLSVPGAALIGTIPSGVIGSGAISNFQLNVAIGGGNLITNSGFEIDTNTDGLADSWTGFVGGAGDSSRVQNYTRTTGMTGILGSYAQRLTIVSLTNSQDSGINNTVSIPAMPSTKYTYSAWIRTNIANQIILLLRQYDGSNNFLTDNTSTTLAATNTWTRLSITFTTNSNTARIEPMIRGLTSVGWFEVDGAQIEIGDVLTAYAPRPQEINPGTIGTTQIADDAITTQKILAGQITAAKIATTSISADNIAAGAIVADKIAAGAVLASKIVVSDTTNIIKNPSFIGGSSDGWTLTGTSLVLSYTAGGVPSGAPSAWVLKNPVLDNANNDCIISGQWMEVRPGEVYYVEWYGASDASANTNNRIFLGIVDLIGTNYTYPAAAITSGANTTWTRYSGQITIPATYGAGNYVPSRAYIGFGAYGKSGGGAAGNWYATKLQVRKASTAELIVDGAITAQKLSVTSLSAVAATTGSLLINSTLSLDTNGVVRTTGISYGGDGIYIGNNSFSVGTGSNKIGFNGSTLTIPAASIGGTIAATVTPPSNWDNANVLVGGTNLIKNSTKATVASNLTGLSSIIEESIVLPDGSTGNAIKLTFSAGGSARISSCIVGNGTYSFSLYHRVATGTSSITFDCNDVNLSPAASSSTSWNYYKNEGFTVSNWTSSVYNFIDINVPSAVTLYIWRPKAEIGNKATTWSPAPEDVDSGIATAATTATWTNVSSRPAELTDGRVSAGLDANGDVNRNFTTTRLDNSNVLRRSTGGVYLGSLEATKGATWNLDVNGKPTTYRVVSVGADAWANKPLPPGLYDETGTMVLGQTNSIYNVAKINRTTKIITNVGSWYVLGNSANATSMANALAGIQKDHIVVIWTWDEPQGTRLQTDLATQMYRCGASRAVYGSTQFKYRSAYILIGIPDSGEGNGFEAYQGTVDNDPNAWCDVTFMLSTNGTFLVSGTGFTPRTLADYNYTGALDATKGATWGTDISNRPAELTDGRVGAGLDANGDVNRNFTTTRLDNSNVLRRSGGGAYTGDLNANNTTNTNQLVDGAGLGTTAVWTSVSSRPAELTDGRVGAGLDSSGDVNRNFTTTRLDSSNVLRRSGGGAYTGALDANNTTNTNQLVDGAGLGTTAVWANVSGAGKPADYASSDIKLNVRGTGLILRGNSCDRPTGGGNWDSDCYSSDGYTGGAYCSFIPSGGTSSYFMAGLNADPLTNSVYNTLDYCFYMYGGSDLRVYESDNDRGTVGTYTAGDILTVAYDGITVRYFQNGTIVRTVAAPANLKLYFDSSIVYYGLSNIKFGPLTNSSYNQTVTYTTMGSGVVVQGNSIAKLSGTQSWDAKAYSIFGYRHGCYVQFSPDQANAQLMIGMNSDPLTGADWSYLDYAWYCATGGYADVRVSGSAPTSTTYNAGDTFTITNDSASVRWYKNGSLIYSVTLAASIAVGSLPTMYFDSSFANIGASASKIQFGPITSLRLNSDSPMLMDAPNGGRIRIFDNGGNLRVTLGYLGT